MCSISAINANTPLLFYMSAAERNVDNFSFSVTLGTEKFRNRSNLHVLKDSREQNNHLCEEPQEDEGCCAGDNNLNQSCRETDRAPCAPINVQQAKTDV